MRRALIAVVVLVVVTVAGAGVYVIANPDILFDTKTDYADYFKDKVETNTEVSSDQFPMKYIDSDGKPVDLADYRNRKSLVIVFTRGYHNGGICPNCSAQTSRLIRNHADFVKRDAEVLLVFPGPKDHLGELIAQGRPKADNAAVPFRILLDPDSAAVDQLGIRHTLAKPSTYILDKQGKVRFAYVGAYASDRPSIKGMLEQLDRLKSEGATP